MKFRFIRAAPPPVPGGGDVCHAGCIVQIQICCIIQSVAASFPAPITGQMGHVC